ncbi:MAG: sugar phosphate isomerase/epimerase [Clostridia bacterium]|nr:sugar phosphate isomerase/epimerase [Clostridia bacterium]
MNLTMNIFGLETKLGLEKALSVIKTAGFDSIDYSLEPMLDPKFILNDETKYRAETERIKALADAAGLPITQTHTPFSYQNWKDPVVYEEFILPSIKRSIEISAMLGAKVAVVHPLHHWTYKGHEEEIFERNMVFYRSLIPLCKEYNIKVGIENMFQRELLRGQISFDTCNQIPEFIRYVDTLDSEYMIACLDIGHVGLPVRDDEAWDFIRALGHDRLQALHVHDNDYRNDRHALPYLGKIDWNEITKALGEIDYQGDFTYEVNLNTFASNAMNEEFIPTAMRYAHDVGRHLCALVDRARS